MKERMSYWHRALVLAAVLALAINVASRYCRVTGGEHQATKSAKSHSPDSERQRLLNNGLHWSAPAITSFLFEPWRVSLRVLPDIPPIIRFYSVDCLPTRAPPSC